MRGKGKNARHKVMSLSALGAGALVFGAGSADAGTITCTPGMEVGWHSSAGGGNTANAACSVSFGKIGTKSKIGFTFKALQKGTSAASFASMRRSIMVDGRDLSFEVTPADTTILLPKGQNATWSVAPHKAADAQVGGRTWTFGTYFRKKKTFGNKDFSNEYALFRFQTGTSTYDYGWIELTYAVTSAVSGAFDDGPEVDIEAWAYDPTANVQLKAGVEPPASTPEPGTLESTGLAALALGAAGLRRWRKTRQGA